MDEDERLRLAKHLLSASAPALGDVSEGLRHGDWEGAAKDCERVAGINSQFPETQKFLQARGLRHFRELDRQGRRELTAHLTEVYRLLTTTPPGIPS